MQEKNKISEKSKKETRGLFGRLELWARANSMTVLIFGDGCCSSSRMKIILDDWASSNSVSIDYTFNPRRADILLVIGSVTHKQIPVLKETYEQMAFPKCVVALGVCSVSGGLFKTYSTVSELSEYIPVDVLIPGCPPSENLVGQAFEKIRSGQGGRE
ncbi:MAG: NADH-quinone oxidoreductase subunit NuoB [Bacteriovoracaceae bacterium]|nr:NADH-quinone oxidoreductase subunit NuoB [Bacteriovoracaceae bacterium]